MKGKSRYIILWLSIFCAIMLIVSCSTKRNTFGRRAYHNLTAHYNAYWNANESMDKAVRMLDDVIIDNYSRILSVYNFGNVSQSRSVKAELDRVMQKSATVIQKHSMRFNSQEHVKWIDDSYLLMGKAYFYSKDFSGARRTFTFIQEEYPDNPIRYDAKMWLIKTHIEAGELVRSKSLLTEFETNFDEVEIPYDIQKEYFLLFAHHYIKSEDYTAAIPYLERAIETSVSRDMGTRLRFILAQIYQMESNTERSNRLFLEVMRRNPVYRMSFQAKLHIAKVFNPETDSYSGQINSLEKMLRDQKNEEYKDQIYDAMAEVARLNGSKDDEIMYLRQAVSNARVDRMQKVRSALKLADIYFDLDRYNDASLYYDTVKQFIPEDFPDYRDIIHRTNILTQLTDNYKKIYLQDSLQKLALLSEEDRNKVLQAIITRQTVVEEKSNEVQRNTSNFINQNNTVSNQNNRGEWYFYNPANISYGYSEFQRKWGDRKLEDNWRLLNKRIASVTSDFLEQEQAASDTSAVKSESVSQNPLEQLSFNIPLTQEAMNASDNIIIDAYYENALIYEDGLKRDDLAIETFEILIERYPANQHLLSCYYHLYQLYVRSGQDALAERYKQYIASDFSESSYAKVVQEPGRLLNVNSVNAEMSALYSTAYIAYENSQFFTAIEHCKQGLRESNDPALLPRFEFLKALAIGKVEVLDSLIQNLEDVKNKYPQHELAQRAAEMLQIIHEVNALDPDNEQDVLVGDEQSPSPYVYKPESSHNYILMIESGSVNLEALKLRLAGFNNRFQSNTELTVSEIKFDETYDLILIARFEDVLQAKNYIDQTQRDQEIMKVLVGTNEAFIISGENYVTFFRLKDLPEYLIFYERFYQ